MPPILCSIVNKLSDAKYLTSMDLCQGFFHISLQMSSRPKAGLAVNGRGLCEFRVMPFEPVNSPKTMGRLMDIVLKPALVHIFAQDFSAIGRG